MGRPEALPEWLPAAVAESARGIFKGILEDDQTPLVPPDCHVRLTALVTDPRMKSVWSPLEAELRKVSRDRIIADRLDEWVGGTLHGVLIQALRADFPLAWWESVPTSTKWQEQALAISTQARALRELLYDSLREAPRAAERHPFAAWDVLDVVVAKVGSAGDAEFMPLLRSRAQATSGRFWSRGVGGKYPPDTPLLPPLPARALLGDLDEELALLEKLAACATLPNFWRVNKSDVLGTRVYVRVLGQVLADLRLRARSDGGRRAGFPLHQIIATIANVALELSGKDEITRQRVKATLLNRGTRS